MQTLNDLSSDSEHDPRVLQLTHFLLTAESLSDNLRTPEQNSSTGFTEGRFKRP
jgi:hypothetical protein